MIQFLKRFLKRKTRTLIFLLAPFLIIFLFIFYMNQFNRRQLKTKFEEITTAEGKTIGHLLQVSGKHLAENGEESLTGFLDRLYQTESIVYIGLFKGQELSYLLSRFEGFFPVVPGGEEYRILDTPVGKIFEISARFENNNSKYRLHMGFDYEFLTTFETTTSRSFMMIAGLFSLLMLSLIALVIYFDKKFFQKELELVREKQEKERFKELSLLTSEIAHEIKNPLNSIYLSFNTLEKHCSADEEAVFYRAAIKDEIKRISGILQTYSDLSKEVKPRYAPVNLASFADSFSFLVEEELKDQRVTLRIDTGSGNTVVGDERLLKQILLNLVKNAAEAGASDVSVSMETGSKVWTVRVNDNGKGIDEELKDSVFKPYISSKTKGMGLGLHISRKLAQAMKGEIHLDGHLPGNTVFRVALPLMSLGKDVS